MHLSRMRTAPPSLSRFAGVGASARGGGRDVAGIEPEGRMGIVSAVIAETVFDAEAAGQAGSAAEAAAPPKKRGGGPRTAEGRARCAKNALREGFRAQVY